MAHSFGVEALVFDGEIEEGAETCAISMAAYLDDLLCEGLLVDAVCCREAHARGIDRTQVCDLNEYMSALRLARESREASLTMGRRFVALAASLHSDSALLELTRLEELHHVVAFGYTCGVLTIDADLTVGSFLHQATLNIISAAQRLVQLGQSRANQIAWNLKPAIARTVHQSRGFPLSEVICFAHVADMACMRHPCLPTRLFVS